MIKVKITKNIIQNKTHIFGLSAFQIIMGVIGFVIGAAEVWLLWGKMNVDIMMSIVFFTIVAFIFFGVIKIQGMTMFKFVLLLFKSVDKRPYCKKGFAHNEDKNSV